VDDPSAFFIVTMQYYVTVIIVLVGTILLLLYLCHRSLSADIPSKGKRHPAQKRSLEPNHHILDRRDFLKLLIVGGTATITSTIMAWKWPRMHWDEAADVVIVGFGAAGTAGAIEAADHGASVIILEKMPIGGGTTLMSGGTIYASETSIQREAGITDSAEGMFKLLVATGRGLNRPELVELVARQSSEIIDWLMGLGVNLWPGAFLGDAFGCELYPEYARITPPVPRVHVVEGMGEGLFRTLEKNVRERRIDVLLETPATELIIEGREVIGVRARSRWGNINIRARKGVILATGGFMYNKEMLARFCQKGYRSLPLGNPGDEGDGIRMALKPGADLWAMTDTAGLPAVRISGQELARPLLLNYYGFPCVLVDRTGGRFVNEGIFYEFVNDALLNLEGDPPAYVVFDEGVRARAEDKIVKYFSGGLGKEIGERLVIHASTIESLATRIGIESARLRETIQRYNDYSSAGRDLDFGKTQEMGLGPLEESPFYAIRVHPGMIATTGGLKINTKAQVLDTSGDPIPRLYAAGRTAGGVIGVVFPASGLNLLDAICFGRVAGRNATLS
jgi:fumarate reductase flavoprotein subunit